MIHYFGYKADGSIGWTFARAGGFDGLDSCNLDDPNCTDALAKAMIASAMKSPNAEQMVGIVKYECTCSPHEYVDRVCDCTSKAKDSSYVSVSERVLKTKPDSKLLVDGKEVKHGDVVVKEPGKLFTVKLLGDIPDGSIAYLSHRMLLPTDEDRELVFNSGVSTEVTMRAPAQGLTGVIGILGPHVNRVKVFIKGFMT